MCCACSGTCCHVGPHSYCAAHGGTIVYPLMNMITTTASGHVSSEELADALAGLLDDTQHAEHNCGCSSCPLVRARNVLAAWRASRPMVTFNVN